MIIKPGETLYINIERDAETSDAENFGQVEKPKGIITAPPPDDYLPRRLSKKSGVNFYDLGFVKDADGELFRDLVFHRSHGLIVNELNEIEQSPPTLADYDALKELIFSIPFDDWKTRYKKLEYETGYRHGVAVFYGQTSENYDDYQLHPNNAVWTLDGLKPPEKMSISGAAFEGADFRNETITKITSELNPAGAAVDLGEFDTADIYLMPRLCRLDGFVAGAGASPKNFVGAYYRLMSRESFLDVDCIIPIFPNPRPPLPVMLPTVNLPFASENESLVTLIAGNNYGTNTFGKLLNIIRAAWNSYPAKYYATVSEAGEIINLPFAAFPPDNRTGTLLYSAAANALSPAAGYVLAAVIKKPDGVFYAWSILENYQSMGLSFDYAYIPGGGDPGLPPAPSLNATVYQANFGSTAEVILNGEPHFGKVGFSNVVVKILSPGGVPPRRLLRVTQKDFDGADVTTTRLLQLGGDYTGENLIVIGKNGNYNKFIARVEVADDYGYGFGAFGEIGLKFLVSFRSSSYAQYTPYATIESLYTSGAYDNGNWTFERGEDGIIAYSG